MKILSLSLLAGILCASVPLALQADIIPAHPVTDINVLAADSDPADIHQVNNKLFFTATDKTGRGLFIKTLKRSPLGKPAVDGKTTRATRFKTGVVPDQFIVTGMQDLTFTYAKLFYHVPGFGLYQGGSPVKKVDLAADNTGGRWLGSLAAWKNDTRYDTRFRALRLFFSGDDRRKGNELFISKGTAGSTKVFADLGQPDFFPYGMVDCQGTLFFGAFDGSSDQLWKSDGTPVGTVSVTSALTVFPALLTSSVTSGCFFSSSTAVNQARDLFHSDGSALGTTALTTTGTFPYALTPFSSGMILAATDATNGYELWYADNTQAYLLNNINPTGSSNPDHLVNAGNEQVYFTANDGTATKLYRTNGTPSGLQQIKTAGGDSLLDVAEIVPAMIIFNGNQTLGDTVYFTTGADHALWSVDNSDGTGTATPVLTALGNPVTHATQLAKFVDNGIYRLYFTTDGTSTEFTGKGTEMWVVGNDL